MTYSRQLPTNDPNRIRYVRYRLHCLYPGPRDLCEIDEFAYREAHGRQCWAGDAGRRMHANWLKRRIRWRLRYLGFSRWAERFVPGREG